MNIINLSEKSKIYTSNVFYVLGDWNTISDTNTLVDVGNDPQIIDQIENINSGLGKKKVDQVILTHSHSDHIGILPLIIDLYKPKVFAFNRHLKGIDYILEDEQKIRLGDKLCEVIHISMHSHDSVCLYCKENGVLFAGDTYFPIEFENDLLKAQNAYAISRLERKNIKTVYYGHGAAHDFSSKKFSVIKTK